MIAQNKKLSSLVLNSGILTHLKVVNCLEKNGWSVVISPYYYDNIADLVKEVDIIAEKQFNSFDRRNSTVQVNVQLFIECKYINQEVIFWFDNINRDKAIKKLEKSIGLRIADKTSGDIAPDELHYLNNARVAKLFSANLSKEDAIYKAVSQCLRAEVYYEQWASGPIANKFGDHPETASHIVRYPLVVCDNFRNVKELEVDTNGQFSTKNTNQAFLLETNYVYLDRTKTNAIDDHFLIDFVNIDYLGEFLQTIDKEAESIKKSMLYIRN